jgi:thiamine-phosphate pyrophosphorylase
MLLYAITNRHLLPGSETQHSAALVELARQWAQRDVHYIQIREKDLNPSELFALTRQIVAAVRKENRTTRILLNGPAQIALEADADGVHLPANAPGEAAEQARELFRQAGREAAISRSCHNLEEIRKAKGASLILYAPIFEKVTPQGVLPGQGLRALTEAVRAAGNIPVFALGGVTKQNAPACVAAGAAGIAAIRLFLACDWKDLQSDLL